MKHFESIMLLRTYMDHLYIAYHWKWTGGLYVLTQQTLNLQKSLKFYILWAFSSWQNDLPTQSQSNTSDNSQWYPQCVRHPLQSYQRAGNVEQLQNDIASSYACKMVMLGHMIYWTYTLVYCLHAVSYVIK